ncbi:hypothetical protein QP096_07980, partial [Alloscardovia omnicolens]
NVGGSLQVESLDELCLIVLGHFLQNIGEAFVVERFGHVSLLLGGQVAKYLRGIGGAEIVELGDVFCRFIVRPQPGC